jgi:hypothetical protein
LSGPSLIAREDEILRTLEALYPKRDKFALIGGYAVDAYSALPRYSVDCDMVISSTETPGFAAFFKSQGYEDPGTLYSDELRGLEIIRFEKPVGEDTVSVDLMVDGIRCRQTEAVWKEREIRESSQENRVVGVNRSVQSRVASRELLIAMKLHSGRNTDLRDVVMLADSANWSLVAREANRGLQEKVVSQLVIASEKMGEPNFEARLKSSFGLKSSGHGRIEATIRQVNRVLAEIR